MKNININEIENIDPEEMKFWEQIILNSNELIGCSEYEFPEGISTISTRMTNIFQHLKKVKIPLSVKTVSSFVFCELEYIECHPNCLKRFPGSKNKLKTLKFIEGTTEIPSLN